MRSASSFYALEPDGPFSAHINNLYNTTFWALVQQGGQTTAEAHTTLKVSALHSLQKGLRVHPHYTRRAHSLKKNTRSCLLASALIITNSMRAIGRAASCCVRRSVLVPAPDLASLCADDVGRPRFLPRRKKTECHSKPVPLLQRPRRQQKERLPREALLQPTGFQQTAQRTGLSRRPRRQVARAGRIRLAPQRRKLSSHRRE